MRPPILWPRLFRSCWPDTPTSGAETPHWLLVFSVRLLAGASQCCVIKRCGKTETGACQWREVVAFLLDSDDKTNKNSFAIDRSCCSETNPVARHATRFFLIFNWTAAFKFDYNSLLFVVVLSRLSRLSRIFIISSSSNDKTLYGIQLFDHENGEKKHSPGWCRRGPPLAVLAFVSTLPSAPALHSFTFWPCSRVEYLISQYSRRVAPRQPGDWGLMAPGGAGRDQVRH